MIQMVNGAAQRNAEAAEANSTLLQEPVGWQKQRHDSYPTTDLNLVTDPFTNEDRLQLSLWLDRRLAPLIGRIYGIPVEASIRANDMFVVRYDHENSAHQRSFWRNHTDDGNISFNVLLNTEFEGELYFFIFF